MAPITGPIKNFFRNTRYRNGSIRESGIYLSPDPEKHLLFSRVKEELFVYGFNNADSVTALNDFGLDETFLERRISSLSGGEKMKLALALSFSFESKIYVLHGTIPWLDKNGRIKLSQIISRFKSKSSIFFIEHELYPIKSTINRILDFDGTAIKERKILFDNNPYSDISDFSKIIAKSRIPIVNFEKVTFKYDPFYDDHRSKPLIDSISFNLFESNIYALLGENGTGKSTLAKLIFRTQRPNSGSIFLCSKSLQFYNRKEICELICYLGQFPEQQIIHSNIGQYKMRSARERNELAANLINNLIDLEDSFPISMLSHFQRKLLLLTSLITSKTKLIILDEPSWGLSSIELIDLFKLLFEILIKVNCSLLVITHDVLLAHSLNAQILWLHNRIIDEYQNVKALSLEGQAKEQFDFSFFEDMR